MERRYFVYIMSSRSRNLYIGVTNNLYRRTYQHKHKAVPGFTAKYKIDRLVYFELFGDIRLAIAREKQVKAWGREKKIFLINSTNPAWQDLAEAWFAKKKRTADPSLRSG